jgi:SAM-dependent methyltransferase
VGREERVAGGEESYAERLLRLQDAGWRKVLPVQLPYALHLKALAARGTTLEVGCGVGRNLRVLGQNAVGVDIDREAVEYVSRTLGRRAYTSDQFLAWFPRDPGFDNLLFSHVLEHLACRDVARLVATYLPYLRRGGRVIVITPQERGYASDRTHRCFLDFRSAAALADALGLSVERQYSFPFARPLGKVFAYNEFVTLLRAA